MIACLGLCLWRGGRGPLMDRLLGAGPRPPPSTPPVAPPGPSEAVLILLCPLLGTCPRQHFPLASLRTPCSSPPRGLVLMVPPLWSPKPGLPPTCSPPPTTSLKPALGRGDPPLFQRAFRRSAFSPGPLEKAVNPQEALAALLWVLTDVILPSALGGRLIFTEDEAEAQRGKVICWRPHSMSSRLGI